VELPPDQFGVVREEEDAAAERDFGRSFPHLAHAEFALFVTAAPN